MIRRGDFSRWTTMMTLVIALMSSSSSRHGSDNNNMGSPHVLLFVVGIQDLENLGHCQKSGCRDSKDAMTNEDASRHSRSSGVVVGGVGGGGGKKYSPSSSHHASTSRDGRSAPVPFVEFACVVVLVLLALAASGVFKDNDRSSPFPPPSIVGAAFDRTYRYTRRAVGSVAYALSSFISGRVHGDSITRDEGGRGRSMRRNMNNKRGGIIVASAGVRSRYVSQDSVASLGSLVDLLGTSDHDSGFFPSDDADVEIGRVGANGIEMTTRRTKGVDDCVGLRPRMRRNLSSGSSACLSTTSSSCHSFESSCDSGSSMWSMDSTSTLDGGTEASWDTSGGVATAPSSTRVIRRRRRGFSGDVSGADSEGKDTILSKFVGYMLSSRSGRGNERDPPSSSNGRRRRRSIDGDGRRNAINDRNILHHRRDGDISSGDGGGGTIMGGFRTKRRSTLDNAPLSHDIDPIQKVSAPRCGGVGGAPYHEQTFNHHGPNREGNVTPAAMSMTNVEYAKIGPGPLHRPHAGDRARGGAGHHNQLHHQQHHYKQQQQKLSPSKSDNRQDTPSATSCHPRHRDLASSVGGVNQTLTLQDLLDTRNSRASVAADCGKSVADSMTEINLSSIA
ncbi:hypothetical protein ACHAXA_004419 [Cyclostephanos tholiformis]|uniref:Uncharacterized protein n=1 Tax=Cyclostephanos tholiformis TaxID=382380 RepID=A0ABD3R1L8_9STRA